MRRAVRIPVRRRVLNAGKFAEPLVVPAVRMKPVMAGNVNLRFVSLPVLMGLAAQTMVAAAPVAVALVRFVPMVFAQGIVLIPVVL